MRIAVAGSIATDHLMTFDGKFKDSLVVDQLDKLSLSFLVTKLDVRRGGVAGNIAFGMGCIGLKPILVGAVGEDFEDYRSWLERHHVDCESVHVSEVNHTARFVCTTDQTQAQIATFYSGAMAETRNIELKPISDRVGGLDLVLIGASDPDGMLRHTEECKERGYKFAADPSQQLAFAGGDLIRPLIDGATYLFSNEYEAALTEQKTGWTAAEILDRVEIRVTTLGEKGVRIDRKGEPAIQVGAAPIAQAVDPTGVGDGFRAGFLAGLSWGLSLERSAQVGCVLAAYVIEADGPQEYTLSTEAFLARLAATYGDAAAAEVRPHLRCPKP